MDITVNNIIEKASNHPRTMAVIAAEDLDILMALKNAMKRRIIQPILVGDPTKIALLAGEAKFNLSKVEVVSSPSPEASVDIGMRLVADKKAHVVMKGLVNSAVFLKAVLKKEYGVRGSGLLSHISLFFPKFFHKPFVVTDAGLNLFPTVEEKTIILTNAIRVMHKLGVEKPKVALLAHNEVPSEKVPASMDAQKIKQMYLEGKFPGSIIDGPLALDLAISREACIHKKVVSEVGGDPDILLCPDILSGNILYKALAFMVKALCAAVIVGADVPMVMTSRAESAKSKLLSVAFASVLAN